MMFENVKQAIQFLDARIAGLTEVHPDGVLRLSYIGNTPLYYGGESHEIKCSEENAAAKAQELFHKMSQLGGEQRFFLLELELGVRKFCIAVVAHKKCAPGMSLSIFDGYRESLQVLDVTNADF